MLEFSDKVIGHCKIEVTESDIENIIVTSFEGGSKDWMGLDNSTPEWEDQPKDEPNSTWATKLILEGKEVTVYDIEDETTVDDDGNPLTITLDKLLKGIAKNYKERPHDCSMETGDSTTADCIVQYAVFDEVVYS
jgi:hypothetical protein